MTQLAVVVLSLARLKKRRRRLGSELKAAGFTNVTWIDAVDGSRLDPTPPWKIGNLPPVTPWKDWVDPYARRAMTMGEVGCSLSHVLAWKHIAASGQPAIVLEDDANLIDDVPKMLPHLLQDLSFLDFNLVYLAQRNTPNPKMLAGRHVHVVDYQPIWTLAYLLMPDTAELLLNIPWQTRLIPADEMLPAAFGLNDKSWVNEAYKTCEGMVLATNQNYVTSAESSETSQTEKSVAIRNPDVASTIFTVATEDTAELRRLMASARRYGASVEVLGMGEEWTGGDLQHGPGGGQKVRLLRDALKGLPSSRPVIFVDGYDTIITRHVADLLDFWRTDFDSAPVFAAETTCWPDSTLATSYPVEDPENPYQFLNSGLFIGTAKDLRQIVKAQIRDDEDDQLFYTKRFLSGRFGMRLDHKCSIFQCLNGSLDDIEVDFGRGMLINSRHQSWPAVVHANGPTKEWLDKEGAAVGGRIRSSYGKMDD